jgi:hypothetical protein
MFLKVLSIASFVLSITACTGGVSSNSNSLSSSPAPSSATGVSANSCAELGGYTGIDLCKQATKAQCTPSTRNILGSSAVCYFPVAGWQSCLTTAASTWSYGTWGSWCQSAYGIYQRTRTATCNRSLPVCECVAASAATESCTTTGAVGYPICGAIGSPQSCNGQPIASPTPTSTPSWCSSGIIHYNVSGGSSENTLQSVRIQRKDALVSTMAARGYTLIHERSSSTTLATSNLTPTEQSSNYRIRISAYITPCSSTTGQVTVAISLFRGNTTLQSFGSSTSGCTNAFAAQTAQTFDQAFYQFTNNSVVPTCQ